MNYVNARDTRTTSSDAIPSPPTIMSSHSAAVSSRTARVRDLHYGPTGLLAGYWYWATITLAALLLLGPESVRAYIPAQATNETHVAQRAGLNFSDVSSLGLQWYSSGLFTDQVSYQLAGADSNGISKGALVHFSEDKLPNGTTTTPWIALVSCDKNSTNASIADDIFTLARDRGAIAALLYSTTSVSCYIDPKYSDPSDFHQVMDIFATKSLASSNRIESQFNNISRNSSTSKYYWFSPVLLNESAADINKTIETQVVPSPGYLFATLRASNATDPAANGSGSNTTVNRSDGVSGPPDNNKNTSLAMIILYAITGCVSALFCIVIISGAIRAIRHPERYGPRSGDAFGPPGMLGPQSRARGLTRAILDTFPVVKFGRTDANAGDAPPPAKDIESIDHTTAKADNAVRADGRSGVAVELRERKAVASQSEESEDDERPREAAITTPIAVPAPIHAPGRYNTINEEEEAANGESSSSSVPRVIPRPPKVTVAAQASSSGGEKDVVPDAIGRETCPICIVDFEEGDDLRVLPCEGHHRFHQECVDQWLLELSSSCPLCRQDFQALQTMMAAGDEGENADWPHSPGSAPRPISSAAARFSRYLRTARRRRQRHAPEGGEGYDATNPPMPLAPRTTLYM